MPNDLLPFSITYRRPSFRKGGILSTSTIYERPSIGLYDKILDKTIPNNQILTRPSYSSITKKEPNYRSITVKEINYSSSSQLEPNYTSITKKKSNYSSITKKEANNSSITKMTLLQPSTPNISKLLLNPIINNKRKRKTPQQILRESESNEMEEYWFNTWIPGDAYCHCSLPTDHCLK